MTGGNNGSARSSASLVVAAANGDETAWAELVHRYTPLVLSVIRAHGMSHADAADVNQTVWLRLVENLDRLVEPAAVAGWLATTTRRECYRQLRMGRRTEPFDPSDDPTGVHPDVTRLTDSTAPDEALLRAERQQALREGFAQLPERCQELLALMTADPPVSYREIGRRLGIPVGSIGPTQARCLQKLRHCPAIVAFVEALRAAEGGEDEHRGIMAARR